MYLDFFMQTNFHLSCFFTFALAFHVMERVMIKKSRQVFPFAFKGLVRGRLNGDGLSASDRESREAGCSACKGNHWLCSALLTTHHTPIVMADQSQAKSSQ